jgi:hypothetical protein
MTGQPQRVIRFLKGAMMRYMPGMMSCAEFDEFIVSYLDGTLPGKQTRRFEFHIRYCRECRGYLLAYQRTVELEKAAFRESEASLPEDVPEDLVQAVLRAREVRTLCRHCERTLRVSGLQSASQPLPQRLDAEPPSWFAAGLMRRCGRSLSYFVSLIKKWATKFSDSKIILCVTSFL